MVNKICAIFVRINRSLCPYGTLHKHKTMCIIIIKQQRKTIPMDILKNSARINPHGLGIVWLDNFSVSYHKSKEYKLLSTDRPFIAHFRYATVGAIGKDNTHPFVCGNNSDELLMMNGTINSLGNATESDSKVLADALGKIPRQDWKQELSKYACRFVTINTRNRSFQIYNKHLYTKKDGVWYSKDNVIQENLVAVYGTLKKGYSNYQRYLRSSNYIGSGVTAKKYPLIINGLPYLMEEEGKGYNVKVDVFSVTDNTLRDLDRLEGHPTFYQRKETEIVCKGKQFTCWIYFNITHSTKNEVFHDTYTQPKFTDYMYDMDEEEELMPSCNQFSFDDVPMEDENPICIHCYNDLQYDEFSHYYCTGCGGWFAENEVTHFNKF